MNRGESDLATDWEALPTGAIARGYLIKQPERTELRQLKLGRLFAWPADQPRHAIRTSSIRSKPVRPRCLPDRGPARKPAPLRDGPGGHPTGAVVETIHSTGVYPAELQPKPTRLPKTASGPAETARAVWVVPAGHLKFPQKTGAAARLGPPHREILEEPAPAGPPAASRVPRGRCKPACPDRSSPFPARRR